MEQIFGYIIIFAIILSFVKLKYGMAIYIAYFFLIPYLQLNVGISLSYNFVCLLFLFAFVFHFRIVNPNRIDVLPMVPFFIYFACYLLLIPAQTGMPYSKQFNFLRIDFMSVVFLPLILWNIMKRDRKSVMLFENVLIFCIIVACLYGLLLTALPGINPYVIMINELTESEDKEEWLLAEDEGRLFGRISSVFLHPMNFALFLGLACIFLFSLWKKKSNFIIIPSMLLVLVNMVVCGVRSVIAGMGITFIYYIIKGKHYKLALYSFLLGIFIILTIGTSTGLSDYLGSMASQDSRNVRGSSLEMRLSQLEGSFVEIRDCFFQGEGYGWTTYYQQTKGVHPTILAFESLLFVILCNSGMLGFLIWWLFLRKLSMSVSKIAENDSLIITCIILFYISYSCITGSYDYMKYFVVFYVIMLGRAYQTNLEKKQIYKNETTNNRILSASVSSV